MSLFSVQHLLDSIPNDGSDGRNMHWSKDFHCCLWSHPEGTQSMAIWCVQLYVSHLVSTVPRRMWNTIVCMVAWSQR